MPIIVVKGGTVLVAALLAMAGVWSVIQTLPPDVTITGHQGNTYYGYLRFTNGEQITFNATISEELTFGKENEKEQDEVPEAVYDPGKIKIVFHKKDGEMKIEYERDMGAVEISKEDTEYVHSIIREIGKYGYKLEPREVVVEKEVLVEQKSVVNRFLDWVNRYRYK